MSFSKKFKYGMCGLLLTLVYSALISFLSGLEDQRVHQTFFGPHFTLFIFLGLVFLCPAGFAFGWFFASEDRGAISRHNHEGSGL